MTQQDDITQRVLTAEHHLNELMRLTQPWPNATIPCATVRSHVEQALSKLRAPVADERAAFEAAWRELNSPWPMNSRMHDDGRYATPDIEREWRLWQARAALASARVADERASEQTAPGRQYHILKTDPEVFQAVLSGAKTFEIRLNDRGYAVGDVLGLRETKHTGAEMRAGAPLVYTGRECQRFVSHVLTGYGLADGWCCLSFRLPHAGGASAPVADERAVIAEATAHVTEALIHVDRVAQRKDIGYADFGTNPRRNHNDTRPYNLKDARHDAYTAAILLRKAWDILEPSISFKHATALASAPVAGEAKKPVAYRAWFDQDNGARWLFTLWPEEERLDVQWEPLYAAPQASACRPLSDQDMDLVAGWLGKHAAGDIGFHGLCERIIQAFATGTVAAAPQASEAVRDAYERGYRDGLQRGETRATASGSLTSSWMKPAPLFLPPQPTKDSAMNELMKYDPATGWGRPSPSHAAQWREQNGKTAWLFNPWTGDRRTAQDVGSDPFGLLVHSGAALSAQPGAQRTGGSDAE